MREDNSWWFAERGGGQAGMCLPEECKPAGKRLNYDGEIILFTLTVLCHSAWGENWKEISSLYAPLEFPLFSSWLVNGLLKWGWWHFGLMGTKVLYRTVKRLCLLFPKNQRQSPSEVSRYRGFIQYFAFLFVVWTSLVVTASCGVWGTSEGRH